MFRSQYLCDFSIEKKCQGPPEEKCDRMATRVLVLPEVDGETDIQITALFVCDICAVIWHGMFSKRNEA